MRSIDHARDRRMVGMVRDGRSHADVAAHFGITRQRVCQIVRGRHGLIQREQAPKGEGKRGLARRERSRRPVDLPAIDVPGWLPSFMRDEFVAIARTDGEEAAASHCRRWKRAIAKAAT